MVLKIAPSILSADFSRLTDEIQPIEAAGANWLSMWISRTATLLPILVGADGWVKTDNIDRVMSRSGVIVSGSGIFRTPEYAKTIDRMRKAVGQL
jgi:pentose-5-phosphate-3-epimerase